MLLHNFIETKKVLLQFLNVFREETKLFKNKYIQYKYFLFMFNSHILMNIYVKRVKNIYIYIFMLFKILNNILLIKNDN